MPTPEQASSNLEWWRQQISTSWKKSAKYIIETGQLLVKAEDALSRVDFAAMIGRPGLKGKLDFSYETARRLMSIGEDKRLSRLLAHGPNLLPPSWRTLHELTKLTDEQFERGLKRGEITSDMERYDVDRLRESSEPVEYAMTPEPEEEQKTRYLTVVTADKTHKVVSPYYTPGKTRPLDGLRHKLLSLVDESDNRLVIHAKEAIELAGQDWSKLKTDRETVRKVRQAADAWNKLAEYLESQD